MTDSALPPHAGRTPPPPAPRPLKSVANFRVQVQADRRGGSFDDSFEAMRDRLMALAGVYFEPDGSVLWCPRGDEQIAAMIYDRSGRVQYVDTWGKCRRASWRRFIAAVLPPPKTAELQILQLPASVWQDLQSFEHSTWQAESDSSHQ